MEAWEIGSWYMNIYETIDVYTSHLHVSIGIKHFILIPGLKSPVLAIIHNSERSELLR